MNDIELQELFSFRNEYRSLRYDLRNIQTLCAELGHPERTFRSVLIAGTNGKGSVAQWIAGMIPGAGLYVSPHLERVNERISINSGAIDHIHIAHIADRDLGEVAAEVRHAIEGAKSRLLYPPTYFERMTAMAFCYFRNRTPHVVLEVGLGGRLDATNVVGQDVSVITSIGLDHQEHLGDTLAQIAFEKAGIIKEREPVVVGPRSDYPAIRERAGDRLIEARPPESGIVELGEGFFQFDLDTPVRSYENLRPGLAGRHQIENAVVAIRAGECLEQAGWPIDEFSIVGSIAAPNWPGRLERLGGDSPFLLDGAHNPDAARALAEYLGRYHPEGVLMVFGVMGGKDARGILEALTPHRSKMILARTKNDRAVDPVDLLPLAPDALVANDLEAALRLARGERRRGETILVTGSLFLVGEARALLTSGTGPGRG